MKAILIFLAGVVFFFSAGGGVAGSQAEAVKAEQERQILSASVMMAITTPNWQERSEAPGEALPIPNDEYRTTARAEGDVVAEGLGTLIADGDDVLLVTHDHWSRFDDTLGTVTFRAADGAWLAEMALRDFKELIRSRDGGIMVLSAPDVLKSAVPVKTDAPAATSLQSGDRGFVAQRAGDRIAITVINVVAQGEKLGLPVVQLQTMGGQTIVGGDSGGGVWINGRFTGAMWTTVRMENTTTGAQRATDLCVAAVYRNVSE